jgi:hypothetical protein
MHQGGGVSSSSSGLDHPRNTRGDANVAVPGMRSPEGSTDLPASPTAGGEAADAGGERRVDEGADRLTKRKRRNVKVSLRPILRRFTLSWYSLVVRLVMSSTFSNTHSACRAVLEFPFQVIY